MKIIINPLDIIIKDNDKYELKENYRSEPWSQEKEEYDLFVYGNCFIFEKKTWIEGYKEREHIFNNKKYQELFKNE